MASVNDLDYAPNARDVNDWQAALLKMLATIDRVCRENGIDYALAFGGLLGAFRHRGFIPWDNDVDIVMTEDNYNKLHAVMNAGKFPAGYEFVDRTTEPDYPLLFGRVVDTNTSCSLSSSRFTGGKHGLFVDVFILFPLPDDPVKQEEAVTYFLVWEQMLSNRKRRFKYRTDAFYELWAKAKKSEKRWGRKHALKRLEKKFRALLPSFDQATWCLHGSGGAFNGFGRFKCEWFRHPVPIKFEDIEMLAPTDPIGFFEQRYGGNWRELPANERFHAYTAANLNIPWQVTTNDYMQLIDKDAAIAAHAAAGEASIAESVALHDSRVHVFRYFAKLQADYLSDKLGGLPCVQKFSGTEACTATREEAHAALEELADATSLMAHRDLKGWHIAVPFAPRLLTAILWARLVETDQYWAVAKTIKLYREDTRNNTFAASEANALLERALAACSNVYRAIDLNDDALLAQAAEELAATLPKSSHAEVARAYLAAGDPAACLAVIDGATPEARANDYLKFLRARMLFAAGKADEGAEAARALAKETNNGMVLLMLSDLSDEHGLKLNTKATSRTVPPAEKAANDGFKLTAIKHLDVVPDRARQLSKERKKLEASLLKPARERAAACRERTAPFMCPVRLTADRIFTWERMYPRRELVRAAVATGNPEEVRKVARVYIEAIYRVYDRDGLGMFIDQEYLDAVLPVLEADRGHEFVEDFLAKIPEAHKEDFDVTLRKAGVNHPYLQ